MLNMNIKTVMINYKLVIRNGMQDIQLNNTIFIVHTQNIYRYIKRSLIKVLSSPAETQGQMLHTPFNLYVTSESTC